MKVHTLHQSQIDGDLHLLQLQKCPLNILFGQISRTSSLLHYLPRHYPSQDGTEQEIEAADGEQKSLKR